MNDTDYEKSVAISLTDYAVSGESNTVIKVDDGTGAKQFPTSEDPTVYKKIFTNKKEKAEEN